MFKEVIFKRIGVLKRKRTKGCATMYDWLKKQSPKNFEYEYSETIQVIEEFTAKCWKNPHDLSRKYSLFTQFICMAAYDQQHSTVLYLSLKTKPTKKLIEEVLLHFKDVKILSYGYQPFQLMLQNVRASSIQRILRKPLHPIITDLFGDSPRRIDAEWFPDRGVFSVESAQLIPYYSKEFDGVMKQLVKYEITSFLTNFLLNDHYRNSCALRYLAYAVKDLKVNMNENNHITYISFEHKIVEHTPSNIITFDELNKNKTEETYD